MICKRISRLVACSLISLCVSMAFAIEPVLPAAISSALPVKNVIIMIPDGMSVGATTITRWYNGGEKAFSFDPLVAGMVRSYSSDAIISDSAPAATAFACGVKAQTGNIGVMPNVSTLPGAPVLDGKNNYSPVANIMEAARLKGLSTGIVSTSEITHATPADFGAHDISRKKEDNIGEQMLFAGFDVLLGGGTDFFVTKRADKEDLTAIAKTRGYSYVTSTADMKADKGKKIIGLFAPSGMSYDLDRDPAKEPGLDEMTVKALSIVSANTKGFVLMVEGSEIDWAAHANDPVAVIGDINAFDSAVTIALDFAKKDKNTVVIILTDHGNSGITIGNSDSNGDYDKLPLKTLVDTLKKAKHSAQGTLAMVASDNSNIKEIVGANYGLELADKDTDALKVMLDAKKSSDAIIFLGTLMAKASRIGFTTTGHTGEDIPLYVYNPKSAVAFGLIQNTDIARYLEKLAGVDLAAVTKRQFQEASAAFSKKGAAVTTDLSNPANPVLVVQKGDTKISFPQNKSVALVGEKSVQLSGVAVFTGSSGSERWFVSQDAIDLVK